MKKIVLLINVLISITSYCQSVTNDNSGVKYPLNFTPYSIIENKNGDTLSWYWNENEIKSYVSLVVAGISIPSVSGIYAPINSATLTGTPISTTGTYGNNSKQISTNEFVYYANPIIGSFVFSSTTVSIVSNVKVKTSSIIQIQNITSGNYIWSSPSTISNTTGFKVYSVDPTSDSFYYFIWNHN